MVMVGGKKVGGYLSLMGGFLLHLTLGTLYCFGNMNTYMTSYLRTHVKGQVTALILFTPSLLKITYTSGSNIIVLKCSCSGGIAIL